MSADFGDNRPDLAAWWMPFTANRQFKADSRLLAAASGMYYRTVDGQEVLDGTSGLWCVNAGHGRAEIAEAVHRQICGLSPFPGAWFEADWGQGRQRRTVTPAPVPASAFPSSG